MALAAKSWIIGRIITLLFYLKLVTFIDAAPQVPCYFIFGDSLSDCGNNNKLQSLAKVNSPPYGIDYPGGVTGRFTNGRTFVDFLGQVTSFIFFSVSVLLSQNIIIITINCFNIAS